MSGQDLDPELPAAHFVGQLLAPKAFSHAALQAGLHAIGRDITVAELRQQPVQQLQQLTKQAHALHLMSNMI